MDVWVVGQGVRRDGSANVRRRLLAGLGPIGLLFGCSPAAPPATSGSAETSASPPAEAGPDVTAASTVATSAGPAPTSSTVVDTELGRSSSTTVEPAIVVSGLPPDTEGTTTTRVRPRPTTTLPEDVDEQLTDEEFWRNQPGFSGVWPAMAECESGNANVDTGNGYSGYFQFSDATWRSMGTGYARAVDAPYAVQLDAAQRLQARSGWGQWPACSRQLGLR